MELLTASVISQDEALTGENLKVDFRTSLGLKLNNGVSNVSLFSLIFSMPCWLAIIKLFLESLEDRSTRLRGSKLGFLKISYSLKETNL